MAQKNFCSKMENSQNFNKTEEWIEKAKKIHGNRYDYSLVEYKGWNIKVKIICSKHGIFEQLPNDHLSGFNCSKCYGNYKMNTIEYIEKAKEIHGDKYDYSLVEYVNNNTKVKIICKTHGMFEIRANSFLQKNGCRQCSNIKFSLGKDLFVEKSKLIHGNLYDYSEVEYINSQTKVKILCKKHGLYEQIPNDHLTKKSGCPKCKLSKGEIRIMKWLQNHQIKYETQKKFEKCKFKRKLPFDFYLPEYNMCIEYDGKQHFEPIGFGSKKSKNILIEKYNERIFRDEIKNKFCEKNNITLLRIPYYNTDVLEDILEDKLIFENGKLRRYDI